MRDMKKLLLSVITAAVLLGTGTSCKKYLNINTDEDTPQNPSVSSVFPAMLAGIPRGIQYDARYVGKYTQNWLAPANANADTWDRHGYVAGSDASGDIWRQNYYGLGKNLDYIIEQALRNKQYDYAGAAYTLKAMMFQFTTDYHGEIIFSEAFKENTYYFKYDTQDKVYAGIDSLCRIAIGYFDQANSTAGFVNTLKLSDYSLSGDLVKWKKLAYGVLARNWSHLSNKSSYKADSVIKYCDNSLSAITDDFVIPFDATKNDDANFFGTYRDNVGSFRQSQFIVSLLDGTTLAGSNIFSNRDPRISHMLGCSADTTNGNGGYRGVLPGLGDPNSTATSGVNFRRRVPVPFGDSIVANPAAAQFIPGLGKYLFKDKAPMPVMTYAEILFIKAEAQFRKGDKAGALATYTSAINAHFDFINRTTWPRSGSTIFNTTAITAAARSAYLAGPNVKTTSAALTLTDIMLQKYIALWGWGWVETWVDLRRYHYTDLDPATGQQVYRNFQLPPAAGSSFFADNLNKPAYRVRPRFNSEYVWNLDQLKLFGGDKADFHTYECWFSKP